MSDLPVLTRTADERIVELQARVAELEDALRISAEALLFLDDHTHPQLEFDAAADAAMRTLNRTPAQSLKRHDVTRADIPDSLIAEIQTEALENEAAELIRITDAMTEDNCEDWGCLRGMALRLLSKEAKLREKVK